MGIVVVSRNATCRDVCRLAKGSVSVQFWHGLLGRSLMAEKGEKKTRGQEGVLRARDVLLGGPFDPRRGGRQRLLRGPVRLGDQDDGIPGDGGYTMCVNGGEQVACGRAARRQPAHWNNYVSVASGRDRREGPGPGRRPVRGAVRRVATRGGSASSATSDRRARSASGSRGRAHRRRARQRAGGCLTWNELGTPDPRGGAGEFDEGAVRLGDGTDRAGRNAGLHHDQELRGSERRLHADVGAARRRPFLLAPLLHGSPLRDEAVEKTRELGGAQLAGPMDLPAGRLAVLGDPQGAAFAVFEGHTDE